MLQVQNCLYHHGIYVVNHNNMLQVSDAVARRLLGHPDPAGRYTDCTTLDLVFIYKEYSTSSNVWPRDKQYG